MLDTEGYKHTLKYVTLAAFALQQWLQKRASILRYTYSACLFYFLHHFCICRFKQLYLGKHSRLDTFSF